jgi:hypothetical protein
MVCTLRLRQFRHRGHIANKGKSQRGDGLMKNSWQTDCVSLFFCVEFSVANHAFLVQPGGGNGEKERAELLAKRSTSFSRLQVFF